ncbi:MAG: dTDP-4-dehydrorhamnose reductase [Tannerella sp.]|jgi:dTDP-4-dehydrorhamnose reductase|nr:dTDP-4-dehydrorhamnose reductase [Tannerella sp.]
MESVLITGANGQLGAALRTVSDRFDGFEFYFTDVDALDICDKSQVRDFMKSYRIDYVVNCAAYTAVDKAEDDEETCMRINCDAVRNIGELAASLGAGVIHISTDYVFDGCAAHPYREDDITHPASVYGKAKLAGERALLSVCENSAIIRTAWLYSETGTNFVKTMLRLGTQRETLGVVADQWGTPTYAGDLADVIKTVLTAESFRPGVYHYTNDGACTWYDFAVKIFELAGVKCEVNPLTTAEYPARAKRPAYSILDKSKIKETYGIQIFPWEDSLVRCLRNLKSEN